MTVFVIPTSTTIPAYRQRVTLDGVTFNLRFRFNGRIGSWLVDFFKEDDTPIVYGRRCVIDWPMFRQHHHLEDSPEGQISVFDTTHRKIDPAIDDFGSRVLMLYFDAETIAELRAAP